MTRPLSVLIHVITVAVTSSYLTLVIFALDVAEDVLWAYAVLVFALTVCNVVQEQREGRDWLA